MAAAFCFIGNSLCLRCGVTQREFLGCTGAATAYVCTDIYVYTFEKGKKFHPEAKPHKNFFLSIHLEGMREKYTAGPQGEPSRGDTRRRQVWDLAAAQAAACAGFADCAAYLK